MKGYMKKMKSKRVLALLMAALMVMTLMVPQTVHAEDTTADQYQGGTELENLLTYYQYVIMTNATLQNHTVGSVAVGGNLYSGNTIGDGAQMASFANKVTQASIGNASGYGAATRDFYYADTTSNVNGDFTENPDYFGSAETVSVDSSSVNKGVYDLFVNHIQPASTAMAAQTPTQEYTFTENHAMGFPVIDITLNPVNTVITIPFTDFQKAKAINISIADMNYLSDYSYTINITGVNSTDVLVDGEAYAGSANSTSTDIFVNGKQYAYLGDMDGAMRGIEVNLSGMKLVWNFPDATGTIKWNAVGGHLVAPNAGVRVTSGRFEGGIIAKGLNATGEAHYFPYNGFTLNTLQNINIVKKYVDENGAAVAVEEQAQFGLFTDEDCKIPVKDANGDAVVATVSATNGIASFPSESLGLDKAATYYVKEISAPEGFEINDTVYLCEFTAGGLVTYSELGKDGVPVYSSSSPVVENLQTEYESEVVGTLIVTVEDKVTREKISDVTITVKDDEGNVVEIKDENDNPIETKTNANGVITYSNIPQGQYTVTMDIPEGYISNDAYSVEVDVLHTTYHTFELEQVKEPIVVYLKEEGTENKVTDGAWVQLQTKDENGNWVNTSSAWTGSLGQVTFKDNVAGDYRVVLGSDPSGWNLVDTQTKEEVVVVAVSDGTDVNEHTFYFDKKVGDVEVTIYEFVDGERTDDVIDGVTGTSVTLVQKDGTKTTLTDSDKDGVVTFEDIPVGDVKVELTTAPSGYVKPSDSSITTDELTVTEGTVEEGTAVQGQLYAQQLPTVETGSLSIETEPNITGASNSDSVVSYKVTCPDGTEITGTMGLDENKLIDDDLPAGDYVVTITNATNSWKVVDETTQVVTVTPSGVTAEYVLTQTGSMEITVVEKDTTNKVGQATVTVKDANGDSVFTGTTTAGTNITVPNLPVGDYTVTVKVPSGYVESGDIIDATLTDSTETKITVTGGNTTQAEAELTLTRYGALTVTVVDKDDTTTVVPGVVVTVYDSANALVGGGTTNNAGQVVVEDLPAGSYTATYTKFASGSSSAQIYDLSADEVDNTEIATITATEDGKAQLEVIKATGDLTVIVKDEETGAPIDGAIVEITAPDGTKQTYTTDETGKIELPDQELGKYIVEVKDVPDDYNMPSQPKTNVTLDKDGEEVIKEVSKYVPGTLIVKIVDTDGNVIEETATVTVDGTEETLTNGVADCGTQPAGDYTVKIIELPDEYELVYPTESAKTATVEDGKETVVKFVLKEIKYDLTVEVRDEDTNKVVPETTVQIIDKDTNEVVAETETDENGKITVEVPKGDYIIKVTEVPDGYDNPSDDDTYVPKEVTVTKDTKEVIEYIGQTVIPPVTDGTLIIQVINQEGYIDGAVVTVDGDAKDVADGEIIIPNLPAKDYDLSLVAIPMDHILDPSNVPDRIATVVAGDETTVVFKLLQVAEVDITVKDEVTGEPIPDATVEVEIGTDPDGNPVVITGKTDENGEVTLDVPVKDDTTIKVTDVPDGYDEPDDKVIDVEPGDNKADFVVEPIGKVTVTVYDKLTGDEVPGAGVALLMHATGNSTEKFVSDANGNKLVLTTGANGTATFDKLADGTYSAVVESVPANYIQAAVEGAADQATVTNGSHEYALHRLYAVGNMSITVVDKATGQVVPNADVTVVGPTEDGTNKQEVNTGATGTIVLKDQIIGDYTLTAEDVEDYEFYGGVSNGNLTVEKGQTAEQKFEVVQTAGMTITVVDKEDPTKPIPGATITVTDPYGKSEEYDTDNNGQVTIPNQPVGENTVVINKVPATNVLPDDTDETITTTVGGSNEVTIEAPKPSTEKGNLTITVVDQVTGAIVPGATVEIKDPSGNVMGTVITDEKGQIKYTDIATGKYTVTVQDVPSGYTKPTGDPTYVTVQVGDNTVKLEIKKPAASGGNTTSKPAPAPSTNTTVITNITVEKAPKTGDISYMPFAVAMMVISVLGLAGITVYRKKTENER